MKRKFRLFGFIALAAIIIFGIAACDDASTDDASTVTGVIVSSSASSVTRGQTQLFVATVIGTNSPAQTVIWTVTGGGNGTNIDSNGLLYVAINESATSLTVRATSTVNASISGTTTVTVTTSNTTFAYDPLVIPGRASDRTMETVITTERTIPRQVLTPANGDSYVMRYTDAAGGIISQGTITVTPLLTGFSVQFNPTGGGAPFTGTITVTTSAAGTTVSLNAPSVPAPWPGGGTISVSGL